MEDNYHLICQLEIRHLLQQTSSSRTVYRKEMRVKVMKSCKDKRPSISLFFFKHIWPMFNLILKLFLNIVFFLKFCNGFDLNTLRIWEPSAHFSISPYQGLGLSSSFLNYWQFQVRKYRWILYLWVKRFIHVCTVPLIWTCAGFSHKPYNSPIHCDASPICLPALFLLWGVFGEGPGVRAQWCSGR